MMNLDGSLYPYTSEVQFHMELYMWEKSQNLQAHSEKFSFPKAGEEVVIASYMCLLRE